MKDYYWKQYANMIKCLDDMDYYPEGSLGLHKANFYFEVSELHTEVIEELIVDNLWGTKERLTSDGKQYTKQKFEEEYMCNFIGGGICSK